MLLVPVLAPLFLFLFVKTAEIVNGRDHIIETPHSVNDTPSASVVACFSRFG
jgi:hypothetical protein